MLISMYTIKDNILKITNYVGKIKDEQDISSFNADKARGIAMIYNLILGLEEASITLRNNGFVNSLYNRLIDISENLMNIETPALLRDTLSNIIELFKNINYDEAKDSSSYNRIASDYVFDMEERKTQHTLEDYEILNSLCKMIETPKAREVNIFCPDASGCTMAQSLKNISGEKIYATDNTARIASSKRVAYKVGKGPLSGSRIQNESFDVLQIFPAIKHTLNTSNLYSVNTARPEKEYIQECFKYLRYGGAMIIALPMYRLYKDVCTIISKNLRDVRVIKAGNIDFNSVGLVYIIGVKDYTKTVKENVYHYLRSMFDTQRVSDIYNLEKEKYSIILPEEVISINTFKGSVLDLEEIEKLFDSTLKIEDVINKQRVPKINENLKNPLLPFNIGQIGLILTSGCLDGIVEEENGCHLIKGRVSKDKNITRDVQGENIHQTEIESNKIEINALLPNGEFKRLV